MLKIDISGLDKLKKNLERMREIDKVPFSELFNSNFMSEHTKFNSFETFMDGCGYPYSTVEEFKQIPDAEFDEYVSKETNFADWKLMKKAAFDEWLRK